MDKQNDGIAFKAAIGALALSFGKEATIPIYEAYWLGLSDLPIAAVQQAVAVAIRTSEQFPRPVDLRRLAGEQTVDQRAIAAWEDVLRAVPLGSYKHVDFADVVINAAIRNLGGWPAMLDRFDGSEGEKWARLEFVKTYAAMAAGGVNGEACRPLPGLAQVTASGGQVHQPRPVRIECDATRLKLAGPIVRPAIAPAMEVQRVEFRKV